MGDLTNKRRPTVSKEIMHNWGGLIYGQCFDIFTCVIEGGDKELLLLLQSIHKNERSLKF